MKLYVVNIYIFFVFPSELAQDLHFSSLLKCRDVNPLSISHTAGQTSCGQFNYYGLFLDINLSAPE